MVTVVIPCLNAEPYIEAAVRSVLNQSLRDVEVVVVDDGSQDNSRGIVRKLADRDRRVRTLPGEQRGPGAARNRGVEVAKGRYLAFVDADDVMLPGALEAMVDSARRSGSDVIKGAYRRHSAMGSHRPSLSARVHKYERVGINVDEFPDILDEPVLWNGLYRTSFWRSKVSPIPEDVNYEDQEPSLAAALQARSIDVLDIDVYSWRLPEGRITRSQSKSTLTDLTDRRTVIHRLRLRLDELGATHKVRQHLLSVWLGRDLMMYAEEAPSAAPQFRKVLALVGVDLISEMSEDTWRALSFWERITVWALSNSDPEVLDDVLATRWEETSAVPLEIDEATGELRCVHPLLERLAGVPTYVRRLSPRDVRLVCTVRKLRFADAHTLELRAEAHVAGLDPLRTPLSLHIAAIGDDEIRGPSATTRRIKARWADDRANDPWRSYTNAGISADVPLRDVPSQRIQVRAEIAGYELQAMVPLPVTSLNYRLGPVRGDRQFALSAAGDGTAQITRVEVSPFVLVRARSHDSDFELEVQCQDDEMPLHSVKVVAQLQDENLAGQVKIDGKRLRIRLPLPSMPAGTLYRGERAYTVSLHVGKHRYPISWDRDAQAARSSAVRAIPTREGHVTVEKRSTRITVDQVTVKGSTARFSGRVDPPNLTPSIWLVSSRAKVHLRRVPAKAGGWVAELNIADKTTASDGYFVRWSATDQEDPQGWCRAGRSLRKREQYLEGPCRSVRLNPHRGGALGVSLGAPLSAAERTRVGRTRLITKRPAPLQPGVFFESFNGKSSGDNPRAIFDSLRPMTDAPLWWSVKDGTVPVPTGATPLVVGSTQWFESLRTAQVLITNNNFPHWFEKQPGQKILQTWHGTPIKRLIFDAPPDFTPLVYRRLMQRQATQWDLLLAQNAESERRLRSALRYEGPVRLGELPRAVRLDQGTQGRARVREELGISPTERTVLYAPTWREKMRDAAGDEALSALMDPVALAAATNSWVLVRSHHMNGLRAQGPGVIDVSNCPHVEDLMLASDMLISDYSSIFFDYRLTGRPMIVHAPDLEWYRDVERGFYGRWPDDPGLPLSRSQSDLEHLVQVALATVGKDNAEETTARENVKWVCKWVLDAMQYACE
ncbi:CDP-glycerol glycerophosphotransferase family protein [Brevibacterium yomogidense]